LFHHRREVSLKKQFIAYFDILGYEQKAGSDETNLFDTINTCIEKSAKIISGLQNKYNNTEIKLKVFSDNFLYCTETNYVPLLFLASHIQAALTCDDVFIRGALCYENLIFTNDFIYGKGIILANEIESKIAIFPRLIIDASFFLGAAEINNAIYHKNFSSNDMHKELEHFYCEDSDGNLYIDYLGEFKYFSESVSKSLYPYSINDLLVKHKNHIQENIRTSDKKVQQKYQWCKKYHNNFCSNNNFPNLLI